MRRWERGRGEELSKAVRCGPSQSGRRRRHSYPLLPRRLAYPEVLGPTPPAGALYDGPEELVRGLLRHAADPGALREPTARAAWRRRMEPWSMETSALALDTLCRELAAPAPRR